MALEPITRGRGVETHRRTCQAGRKTERSLPGVAQSEARVAHNHEVTGSKPVAGLYQFARFTESGRHNSSDVKT